MQTPLKQYMSRMGTGPKSSDDLNYQEARGAMSDVFDDALKPTTFGAFTVAARWKGQTPEELAGFLDHIRDEHVRSLKSDRDFYLDISGRFDGKVNSVNTDLAASVLTVAAGVPVLTHSERSVPTQEGTTLLDVLEQLGLPPAPTLEVSETALDRFGFAYTAQSVYAPELAELKPLRRDLGVRCFLNTIESMVNPSDAPVHVGSFYHLSFASRVCETFERSETMDPDRVVMIQGIEGQTELRSGDCLIAEWNGGDLEDHEYNSADYGLGFNRDDLDDIGARPDRSAELFNRMVNGGTLPESYRESVLWNTASRLMAGGEVDSLDDGLDEARTILESSEPQNLWDDVTEVFDDG